MGEPREACPRCGRRYFEIAGVENCLADHAAEDETRPRELHTRFTCEELELLLRSGAQLWGGLLEFDDINDATDPDMVDAWEKLFREYMQVLYKNVQEKNGWDPEADFPGATRIPR